MRSFQERLSEFQRRRVQLVAISVDPPDVTLEHTRKLGFTFAFLSDQQHNAIRSYDLVHGSPEEGPIARSAEFLIDSQGIVRWRNLTPDYYVRLRPEQVFEVLDQLGR